MFIYLFMEQFDSFTLFLIAGFPHISTVWREPLYVRNKWASQKDTQL